MRFNTRRSTLGLPEGEILAYLAYCSGIVCDVERLCTNNESTHKDRETERQQIHCSNYTAKPEYEDTKMKEKFNGTNHLKC